MQICRRVCASQCVAVQSSSRHRLFAVGVRPLCPRYPVVLIAEDLKLSSLSCSPSLPLPPPLSLSVSLYLSIPPSLSLSLSLSLPSLSLSLPLPLPPLSLTLPLSPSPSSPSIFLSLYLSTHFLCVKACMRPERHRMGRYSLHTTLYTHSRINTHTHTSSQCLNIVGALKGL